MVLVCQERTVDDVREQLESLKGDLDVRSLSGLLHWVRAELPCAAYARDDNVVYMSVLGQLRRLSVRELHTLRAMPLRQLCLDVFMPAARSVQQFTTFFRLEMLLSASGFVPASKAPVSLARMSNVMMRAVERHEGEDDALVSLFHAMRGAWHVTTEHDHGSSVLKLNLLVSRAMFGLSSFVSDEVISSAVELVLDLEKVSMASSMKGEFCERLAPIVREKSHDDSAEFSVAYRFLCWRYIVPYLSKDMRSELCRIAAELMSEAELSTRQLRDLACFCTSRVEDGKAIAVPALVRALRHVSVGGVVEQSLLDDIVSQACAALRYGSPIKLDSLDECDATAIKSVVGDVCKQLLALPWAEGVELTATHSRRRFMATRLGLLCDTRVVRRSHKLRGKLAEAMLPLVSNPTAYATPASRAVINQLFDAVSSSKKLTLQCIDASLLMAASTDKECLNSATSFLHVLSSLDGAAAYRPAVGSYSALFHALTLRRRHSKKWLIDGKSAMAVLTTVQLRADELQTSQYAAVIARLLDCNLAEDAFYCNALLNMDAQKPLPATELHAETELLKLKIMQVHKAGDVNEDNAAYLAATYAMLAERRVEILTSAQETVYFLSILLAGRTYAYPSKQLSTCLRLLSVSSGELREHMRDSIAAEVMKQSALEPLIEKFALEHYNAAFDAFLVQLFYLDPELPSRIKTWPVFQRMRTLRFQFTCPAAARQLVWTRILFSYLLAALAIMFTCFAIHLWFMDDEEVATPKPWDETCGLSVGMGICRAVPWLIMHSVL